MLSRVTRRLVLKPARADGLHHDLLHRRAATLRVRGETTARPSALRARLPGKPEIAAEILEVVHAPGAQPVLAPRLRQAHYSLGSGRGSQLHEEDWRGSCPPAPPLAHSLQARRTCCRRLARLPRPLAARDHWCTRCRRARCQLARLAWLPRPLAARLGKRQAGGAERKGPTAESPTFEAVIDSGCTRHSHPRRKDLIHTRHCD